MRLVIGMQITLTKSCITKQSCFNLKKSEPLPETFKGLEVIDGDTHDMRFLDEPNKVVGLRAKGKAKTDDSGFVIQPLRFVA